MDHGGYVRAVIHQALTSLESAVHDVSGREWQAAIDSLLETRLLLTRLMDAVEPAD